MSHGRSTPSPTGSEEFVSEQPSTHQFASTTTGFTKDNVRLTRLEGIAVRGSDPAFNAFSGAVGGFASGIVTCPLDVIKTKLQAQGGFRAQQAKLPPGHVVYRGLLGTARIIWGEEGLKGLYRGLGPIILGYLPTWAVWFTVYGKSKEFFGKHHGMCFRILLNYTRTQANEIPR